MPESKPVKNEKVAKEVESILPEEDEGEPGETVIAQPNYGIPDENGYVGVDPVPVRSSHIDEPLA